MPGLQKQPMFVFFHLRGEPLQLGFGGGCVGGSVHTLLSESEGKSGHSAWLQPGLEEGGVSNLAVV